MRIPITSWPRTTAASRASGQGQRTFGLYRTQVLAALATAVLLFGVAIYVLVEADRRFAEPPEVLSGPMRAVAVTGLIANLVAFHLLRSSPTLKVDASQRPVEPTALLSGGWHAAARLAGAPVGPIRPA